MAVELANAAVSGVASQVAETVFDTIKREISYVFKYQSYLDDLENQVQELCDKRQMVEEAVNHARSQGDEIYEAVQRWLISVNEFTADGGVVKSITAHKDEAKKCCFRGLCPDLLKRYNLSKKAFKAAKEGANLLGKGNFSNVSYRPAPERTEFKNVVRGYQQFGSRMTVFQNVMEVLKDSKVNMIGVYGMGGVGKTTLVKEVGRQAMEEKLFHEVVMAEVTQSPDPKAIQDQIANCLNLTFDMNESVYRRADRLCKRLNNGNRVLVILDNLWGKLDLETVGIPYGGNEQGKCCTVLLTSRSEHLLSNLMNSQKNFSVGVLSDKESMGLFCKTVGDHDSTQTSGFQHLGVQIVGKCGGLPIAIKTAAVALKNKSLRVWKDALNHLRNSNLRDIPGMGKEVYSTMRLSYDLLEIEEAKSLFLLCALQNHGSQIPINDLVMYVMGLDSFKNVNSVEEGRNRVHALIENLKTSCLLSDGDIERVTMHDVIHDVAVSIAKEELMFNVQDVGDFKEELEKVIQKDPIAISLPGRDVQELPERLECPKLRLFLLFTMRKLGGDTLRISDLFFEGMKELRVLHVPGFWLPSISLSLGCLINLRTLSLNHLNPVINVAIVGKLTKLEILSFRGSDIKLLPLEIGQLTRLKLLDLRDCRSLKVIAPEVISKLSRLEELYIGKSFTHWENGEGRSNASLVELKALSKLTTLEINISNVVVMPQDLFSVELERYNICIGDWWNSGDRKDLGKYERKLKLDGRDKSTILGSGMKKLLKKVEYLHIERVNYFQNVVNELHDREDFQQLKHLQVEYRSEILYGVNSKTSAQNLTNLTMEKCSRLKFLFSYSMVNSLGQLQKLVVAGCKSVENVIDITRSGRDEEQMIESVIFPKLEYLELSLLPKLTRFMSISSLDSEEEENNLLHHDTQPVLFDKKWNHQLTADSFSNLKELEVHRCNKLTSLFSSNIITGRRFKRLEILKVTYCNSIEEIIEEKTSSSTGGRRFEVFPQLIILALGNLPKLKSIHQGIHILEWSALRSLAIYRCNRVEVLFASLESEESLSQQSRSQQPVFLFDLRKVQFPNLEILDINFMGKLKKIWLWHHQLTQDSFSKLKELRVIGCHKLTSIFSLNIINERRFERLEILQVQRCDLIEEIMEEQRSSSSHSRRRFIVFPQLINLLLHHLPKLKSIYQGMYILEWPALKDLRVSHCDKVEIVFAFSEISRLLESQQPIILVDHHKVAFPNLKTLRVDYCDGLRSLVTLSTAEHQVKLARMKISNCKMIKKIIEMQVGERVKEDPIVFSQLEYLEVHNLSRLESFCLENYTLEFPYLEQVVMSACTSMKTFSQGVIATPKLQKVQLKKGYYGKEEQTEQRLAVNLNSTIQKLFQGMSRFYGIKDLKLSEFSRLKEIWDGHPHALPFSFFSNLTSLVVDDCTFMSSAIPANLLRFLYILNSLEVRNCDSVEEVFHLEDPYADIVQVFPVLRTLKLVDLPKLKRLCNFRGKRIELRSLKTLWVENCPNMETFISDSTPASVTVNIEPRELTSEGHFLTDVQPFFDEKVEFPNLSELKLSKLPKLLHLPKNYCVDDLFSLWTFKNLTTLEISKCDGLINLVTLSRVNVLEKLTRMNINDCKMIEEIIQQPVGEEEKKYPFAFSRLKYLELSCLSSLTSFCSGNCTLEFPSLEHVLVKECPKMEIFSRGVLSTPKLQRLQLTELDSGEEGRWEGSLNSTIQKLFQEMNSKVEN